MAKKKNYNIWYILGIIIIFVLVISISVKFHNNKQEELLEKMQEEDRQARELWLQGVADRCRLRCVDVKTFSLTRVCEGDEISEDGREITREECIFIAERDFKDCYDECQENLDKG